jgi:hypothetical protein
MYSIFLPFGVREYLTLLISFVAVDICAIILLAAILHRMAAAAAAIAVGGLLHLVLYTLRWTNRPEALPLGIAGDTVIIMVMLTATYKTLQPSSASDVDASIATTKGFWSSLDQANKVALITSLITAASAIVSAIIGLLPGPR